MAFLLVKRTLVFLLHDLSRAVHGADPLVSVTVADPSLCTSRLDLMIRLLHQHRLATPSPLPVVVSRSFVLISPILSSASFCAHALCIQL